MDQAVTKILQALRTIQPYTEVEKFEEIKKDVVANYINEVKKDKEWEILFQISQEEENRSK